MNAAAILAIPADQPERLFKTEATIRQEYHGLVMCWHPDRNKAPEAKGVMMHLAALYAVAVERIKAGTWAPANTHLVTTLEGKRYRIKYRRRHAFELGTMLVGLNFVTFVIGKAHEDLVIHGLRQSGAINYPDDKFRRSIAHRLPHDVRSFEVADGWIVVMPKHRDEVLLEDLIAHLGGRIPPKHTAWVISSLLDLACFLAVNNMTHNGLSPETVFVSPRKHAVSLYGGWWYATGAGKLISHLPPQTHRLASRRLLAHKVATHELDLESIRAIGRACLGDASGGSIRAMADVPAPLSQFLQTPSSKSPFSEYEDWSKVLTASFGPRRFHELNILGDDVYPGE